MASRFLLATATILLCCDITWGSQPTPTEPANGSALAGTTDGSDAPKDPLARQRINVYCDIFMRLKAKQLKSIVPDKSEFCEEDSAFIPFDYLTANEESVEDITKFLEKCEELNVLDDCGNLAVKFKAVDFNLKEVIEYCNWDPSTCADSRAPLFVKATWDQFKGNDVFALKDCEEYYEEAETSEYYPEPWFEAYKEWLTPDRNFCHCKSQSFQNLSTTHITSLNKLFDNFCTVPQTGISKAIRENDELLGITMPLRETFYRLDFVIKVLQNDDLLGCLTDESNTFDILLATKQTMKTIAYSATQKVVPEIAFNEAASFIVSLYTMRQVQHFNVILTNLMELVGQEAFKTDPLPITKILRTMFVDHCDIDALHRIGLHGLGNVENGLNKMKMFYVNFYKPLANKPDGE